MHALSVAAAACPSRRAPCRHRAASRTCVRATRKVTQHTTGGDCDIAVHIYGTAEEVAAALCARVEAEARDAVAKRGVFALAVPGGSVLKMLAGLTDSSMDWSKVVLAYANHKCVPLDAETSTHAKALKLFLGAATRAGCVVITPGGSDDAPAEAAKYNARLLGETRISKEPGTGVCQFDLCLLGMGSDGHVGSLYPNRPEVLSQSQQQCLSVVKGSGPSSITLSLAVMNAARCTLLAMTGASKADAVQLCLEDKQPEGAFPAQMVRSEGGVNWMLDEGAASKLKASKGVAALL